MTLFKENLLQQITNYELRIMKDERRDQFVFGHSSLVVGLIDELEQTAILPRPTLATVI
jgi:hypothetical protein